MASRIHQIIRQATHDLTAVSASPRLDAEVLLMHVTGLSRSALITHADEVLGAERAEAVRDLYARRARGEPIAYLTGHREFWSLDLLVTPDVLIPRPETELLVEQALTRIPPETSLTIADLGTGSGAVALAIAKERPRCHVIATDISTAALAVAQRNALQLDIRNVEFRHGDWFAPLTGLVFDLIVSNPPYIAQGDVHLAQGDVRFEPSNALVAGDDGLEAIRHIAADAAAQLRPGGWLLLEHGADQGAVVARALAVQGYTSITGYTDLAGLDRVMAARQAG
jgi:release factor glutamine methyltransferase